MIDCRTVTVCKVKNSQDFVLGEVIQDLLIATKMLINFYQNVRFKRKEIPAHEF